MTLKLTPDRRREIAEKAGINPIYLSQVLNGGKDAKPRLAHRLVAVSDGELKLWHVRQSDWFEVWPDLIGSDGAPEPVAPGAAAETAGA